MMRSRHRWLLAAAVTLLALGTALFIFARREQDPTQIYSAVVNRDCAPWDGAAFTVMVPYDPATIIYISIWKSPDFLFPSTFTFPDETGQVGNVYTLPELGPYTLLSGEVSFQRVQEGIPLEGRFNLESEAGETFEGGFIAEWGNQVVYCG